MPLFPVNLKYFKALADGDSRYIYDKAFERICSTKQNKPSH